jgi:hypothetical protein
MSLSSLDSILALADLKQPTKVFVKAWGQDVFLLDPSADIRDEWEIFCASNQGKPASWRAKLASLLLCDETGNRLCTTEAGVKALGKKSAAALAEIWEAGLKLLTVTDSEVDELAKN